MSNTNTTIPAWYNEYLTSFTAAEAHAFILYGDISGYASPGVSQRSYLIQTLAGRRDVVMLYDRAQGITFATPSMREKALQLLDTPQVANSDQNDMIAAINQTLGTANWGFDSGAEQTDIFTTTRKPNEALGLLERLLRTPKAKGKIALIIEYADTICPPSDKGTMGADALTLLVMLQLWGSDRNLARQDNPIFLLTRQLTDLHPDLRTSSSNYKAIEIALPDTDARLAYITWYLARRNERNKPIPLDDVTIEELAQTTAGLNLRHLEDILLLAARAGGVSRRLVKARKDAIIATEFSEVAEMIEPLPDGFAALGGMAQLIAWSRAEIIQPLRAGNQIDAPKGVLLVGPPGGGKTYWLRALSAEIGFNCVALRAENILGGIVGESERKLKQFFAFCRALSPVLVFLDELDQSDVSKRSTNNANPVAANLFNAMLQFMSDETLRGRVIVVFASNRPDLIDPALLRFGRMDKIVPVLLPGEAARREIVVVQARAQRCPIIPDAADMLAVRSDKYSAADLAAVVKKARALAARESRSEIGVADVEAALRYIRPATLTTADWYTLLAVQACNDTELLPDEYVRLMADRAALRNQIKAVQPDDVGLREERSW